MVLGETRMTKDYKFKMYYNDLWRLSPLQRIDNIPNLTEIQEELEGILSDIKKLIEVKQRAKGSMVDKWKASKRVQKFNKKLEKEGIVLIGFAPFLRERLGVGIDMSSLLIRLAFFTKKEIEVINKTLTFRELKSGRIGKNNRRIPHNYKELIENYFVKELSKEEFREKWFEEEKRIPIKL